eukprot:5361791-Pleurochrysis_carterae.AAC.1
MTSVVRPVAERLNHALKSGWINSTFRPTAAPVFLCNLQQRTLHLCHCLLIRCACSSSGAFTSQMLAPHTLRLEVPVYAARSQAVRG